jgi:hypothetical protein
MEKVSMYSIVYYMHNYTYQAPVICMNTQASILPLLKNINDCYSYGKKFLICLLPCDPFFTPFKILFLLSYSFPLPFLCSFLCKIIYSLYLIFIFPSFSPRFISILYSFLCLFLSPSPSFYPDPISQDVN